MNQQSHIPVNLLLEHGNTFKGLARIALRTVISATAPAAQDWRTIPPVSEAIAAPSNELIDHYVLWSGASLQRYKTSIPPHMVSQWGLAAATNLLLQTAYPLAKVINQGVSMQVHGELPRNTALLLNTRFHSVQEKDGLVRVSVQIVTGTTQQPNLVDTTLHMAFILPSFKKAARTTQADDKVWQTVGTWQATHNDGLKFAMLTGDFNPIHWIGLAGKLSSFGQKVLHGFGMIVRSYELLPDAVQQIDVRFVKPVLLPSKVLSVQTASTDVTTVKSLRLVGSSGEVHLVGSYQSFKRSKTGYNPAPVVGKAVSR